MTQAQLFFLSDKYYLDFPDDKLMKNKDMINGVQHNRPCFFAFPDIFKIYSDLVQKHSPDKFDEKGLSHS